MEIWFARYTLTPRRRLSAIARDGVREGALLRVGDGFADVHPWPELGDAPLDEQLALLARGELTPLTRCSLRCAALDGEARRRGVSLFEGLIIPESHWTGDDPPEGFDTVKLKSAAKIPAGVRVRLDLNATLSAPEFERMAMTLPRERIDFIEDPCPYDGPAWRALRERTGLRLALDRGVAYEGVDVLVVKPALASEWPAFHGEFDGEIVVTSYMDHPVGQMFAAYVAATHAVSARCGLFTHVLYEAHPFSEAMRSDGARLLSPGGTGLGFDELLASLPWKRVA
ncbi:MAG TPA: hypothetical protein VGF48_24895 [Thermoanaerobaculia bacterium]|jgi:O-succinylbenzoate synthase